MSFFSKTPIQQIDYDINPSDWDATNTQTVAKLSLERMKFKSNDVKRQQQIREKPWYVDVPYFLKGIVPDGTSFKVANVEPEIKGRFYGKDPTGAKGSFESYYTMIKEQETKKLQQKLKELKVKKVIKATETAQQILQEGNPTPPSRDVTEVLSEGENPTTLQGNTPSWTTKNVNALASQQAMSEQAEKALAAPTSLETTAQQRNKLRAAMAKKTGTTPSAKQSVNARTQKSLSQFKSKVPTQTRKQKPGKENTSINQQIATMFNGGRRNKPTRKVHRGVISKV